MTNTINNVPFELLETLIEQHITAHGFTNHTARQAQLILCAPSPAGVDADHIEDVRAMVADPSPAGVDGLEVATFLHALHMELGQTEQFCSKWKGDPFGVSGVDYSSTYSVTSEPLCRLSDAQAIIDGLRGEVDQWQQLCAEAQVQRDDYQSQRDQQAQRIGELEGLLRHAQKQVPTGSGLHMRIDAALSAGKEG